MPRQTGDGVRNSYGLIRSYWNNNPDKGQSVNVMKHNQIHFKRTKFMKSEPNQNWIHHLLSRLFISPTSPTFPHVPLPLQFYVLLPQKSQDICSTCVAWK